MFMDKRTLMTIKKTIYKGYSHTCDIITVYKLFYLDIRLDILICLKDYHSFNIQLYIYIYIHLVPSTKDTYMKIFYNIIGFLLFVLREIGVETS